MRLPFLKANDGKPLRIPLPKMVTCYYSVYFRPANGALPTADELLSITSDWLQRHTEEPLTGLLQAFLAANLLRVSAAGRGSAPEPTPAMIHFSRPGELEERRYEQASHVVSIEADDLLKHPRAGFWAALAAARAIAGELNGVALNASQGRLAPISSYEQSLPTDAWVGLREHLMIPHSIQANGKMWMTTTGMDVFGLPNLQVKDAPPNLDNGLADVLCGLGQHLALTVMRLNQESRERVQELVIGPDLTISERDIALARGEGFDRPATSAGRTAVISLRLDPHDGFLTLVRPAGFRGDHSEWLHAVLASLFEAEDKPTSIESGNELMEIAHRKALSELPAVKARFQGGLPRGATFFVKVDFPDRTGDSHFMWVAANSWNGDSIQGQIANDTGPNSDLRPGQTVRLPEARVYDWMISFSDGKFEGNYTGKVLLDEQARRGNG